MTPSAGAGAARRRATARRSRRRCSIGSVSRSATLSSSARRASRSAPSWSPSRTGSPPASASARACSFRRTALARERPHPARLARSAGRRACCSARAARRRARPPSRRFVDDGEGGVSRGGLGDARRDRTSRPDFSRDLDRFGEFLALVGLISLVVGGVGVANAAQGFVERKRATLAILKALGASGGAVVALALVEFLAAALIGVGAGLAIGAATPFAVAALFAAVLPLPLAPAIYPSELALGALYGVLTALAFSVAPLGRAHDIPVSQLFRNLVETRRGAAAPALFRRRGARPARRSPARRSSPARSAPWRSSSSSRRRSRSSRCASSRLGAMALARRAPRVAFGRLAHGDRQSSPAGRADPFGRPVARARPGGARRADAGRFQSARPIAARHAGRDAELLFPRRAQRRNRARSAAFSASRRRGRKSSRRR